MLMMMIFAQKQKGQKMAKTKYDFECMVDDILITASNVLTHEAFDGLLDSISMMLADYERDDDDG